MLEALTLFCSMLVGYGPLDAIGHLHVMLNGDCILASLYDNKVCMFESLRSYAFNAHLSNKSWIFSPHLILFIIKSTFILTLIIIKLIHLHPEHLIGFPPKGNYWGGLWFYKWFCTNNPKLIWITTRLKGLD